MISPFLAPRSLPSFLSECTGLVATTALPGNSPSHIQSPWSVPQIFFIAQLALSPPAFDVYRRLGAAVLQPKFSLEAFLSLGAVLSSCRRLLSTSTVRQASFGYRCSSGTVLFIYLTIFFIYSVSPVCPFLPLLFASGLRSERRLFYPLSHFLCCSPLFRSLFMHCVTNVTHSLGLGLRVFCPVLPVSLPFCLKVRRGSNHLGFRGRIFPCYGYTNTLHVFFAIRGFKFHVGK